MGLVDMRWRKATGSLPEKACVELACAPGERMVRDSKNPDGPTLAFPADAVARLMRRVR